MDSLQDERMSAAERRAGLSLAAIFALRMLGLFLVLPVFSIYAKHLPGGENAAWVGFAFGAFGLTQACLHIPYGMASDFFGRKRVITIGLLIFALGSIVAAMASNIYLMALGRSLQGAGAVSSAVSALAADLSRPAQRTKIMAMIGSSIGVVFALSLIVSPLLYHALGMPALFLLIAVLSLLAIPLLWKAVPNTPQPVEKPSKRIGFWGTLRDPELKRMNVGVFVLHLIQMAMFMVIPRALEQFAHLTVDQHWRIYLPVVLASFVVLVPTIIFAERRGQLKPIFLGAIALLAVSQTLLTLGYHNLLATAFLMFAFFAAFNFLEAAQPSLVSRYAHASTRGAALGIYNVSQSLGTACGSLLGGLLYQHYGYDRVFETCAFLAVLWLGIAFRMRPPLARQHASSTVPAANTSAEPPPLTRGCT